MEMRRNIEQQRKWKAKVTSSKTPSTKKMAEKTAE